MPSCEELVKVFRSFATLRRKKKQERSVFITKHGSAFPERPAGRSAAGGRLVRQGESGGAAWKARHSTHGRRLTGLSISLRPLPAVKPSVEMHRGPLGNKGTALFICTLQSE